MQWRAILSISVVLSVRATFCGERVVLGWSAPPSTTDPAQGQQAVGFTAEVIREAARRGGIELSWRETRDGADADQALEAGLIDVAPAAIPTAERRSRFYVTEPWWNEDLALVVRADGPQTEAALAGKRIALKNRYLLETARRAFPDSILMPPERPGTAIPMSLVCQGKADAALMTHRDADMMIGFNRPAECLDERLSTLDSMTTLGLAVMSRREKADVARRLRARIDELTADGTLARIAARHPGIAASSAAAMAERMRQHTVQRGLWAAVYALLALIVIAGAALWRMHIIIQARRKAENALKEQETLLRRSNVDLEAYAYTVSHDLQEPLRMVTAYVDLLVKKHGAGLNGEAHRYLDVARTGAVRMSTMLRDLLEFSRAGRNDVDPGLVNTETAAMEAVAALAHRVSETGADVEIARPLPIVQGWPDQMQGVFQNLIENSLKYRRDGVAPKVRVEAARAGDDWQFTVADNGIGFDMAYAEKIFRVFQRLHGRTYYSGNGIGLSIARRIVERHGGRIWVEWSQPGEGSHFCFTLPAVAPGGTGKTPQVRSR